MPSAFALYQNRPNPFNPATIIRFALPQQSLVRLTLFDVIGREVAILDEGERVAGYHDVLFDAHGLASGIYFFRLQAGGFLQTRRMVLLR